MENSYQVIIEDNCRNKYRENIFRIQIDMLIAKSSEPEGCYWVKKEDYRVLERFQRHTSTNPDSSLDVISVIEREQSRE